MTAAQWHVLLLVAFGAAYGRHVHDAAVLHRGALRSPRFRGEGLVVGAGCADASGSIEIRGSTELILLPPPRGEPLCVRSVPKNWSSAGGS